MSAARSPHPSRFPVSDRPKRLRTDSHVSKPNSLTKSGFTNQIVKEHRGTAIRRTVMAVPRGNTNTSKPIQPVNSAEKNFSQTKINAHSSRAVGRKHRKDKGLRKPLLYPAFSSDGSSNASKFAYGGMRNLKPETFQNRIRAGKWLRVRGFSSRAGVWVAGVEPLSVRPQFERSGARLKGLDPSHPSRAGSLSRRETLQPQVVREGPIRRTIMSLEAGESEREALASPQQEADGLGSGHPSQVACRQPANSVHIIANLPKRVKKIPANDGGFCFAAINTKQRRFEQQSTERTEERMVCSKPFDHSFSVSSAE